MELLNNEKVLFCGTTNLDYFIYKLLPVEGVQLKVTLSKTQVVKGKSSSSLFKTWKQTFFYTRLSNDMAGRYLYSSLVSNGVKTKAIKIVKNNKSGVALIFVDEKARNLIGLLQD